MTGTDSTQIKISHSNIEEKIFVPWKGKGLLIFAFVCKGVGMAFAGLRGIVWPALAFILICIALFFFPGFFRNGENQAIMVTLCGKYKGTIKVAGFFWCNPFKKFKRLELLRHVQSGPFKITDTLSTPIKIGMSAILFVVDTCKFNSNVDYVYSQPDDVLKTLAMKTPLMKTKDNEVSLRCEEINFLLQRELQTRLENTGIEVKEAGINFLATDYEQLIPSPNNNELGDILVVNREDEKEIPKINQEQKSNIEKINQMAELNQFNIKIYE
jgi:regulator of protease activity HflC (stomatin/prohibitin superfamily)